MKQLLGLLWLTAGLAFSQHSVTLSWTAPVVDVNHDPPTSYDIKRSATAGGPYTTVGSVAAPQLLFTDLGAALQPLKAGDTWFYIVVAVNSGGNAASIEAKAGPIPAVGPGAPTMIITIVK